MRPIYNVDSIPKFYNNNNNNNYNDMVCARLVQKIEHQQRRDNNNNNNFFLLMKIFLPYPSSQSIHFKKTIPSRHYLQFLSFKRKKKTLSFD